MATSAERPVGAHAGLRSATGPTVAALLDDGTVLATSRVRAIVRDAAEALLAHGARTPGAYGCLSPAAIRITAGGRAELLARGAAQAALAGSTAYTAPEQRNGGARVDARADQYALALVVYEMLSGKRRESRNADGTRTLNEVLLVPGRPLRPDVGPGVNDVLRRALSRDPEHRYATVEEFLAGLERCAVGRPASAPVRGHSLALAPMVAVVTASVVAAGAGATMLSPAARDQARVGAHTMAAAVGATLGGGGARQGSSFTDQMTRDGAVGGSAATPARPLPDPSAAIRGAGISSSVAAARPGREGTRRSPKGAPGSGGERQADQAVGDGSIAVAVDAGLAIVIVDGVPRGTVRAGAPYIRTVAPGEHRVSLRGIGHSYRPADATATVGAGASTSLSFASDAGPTSPAPR